MINTLVTYINYTAGTTKGEVTENDLFNNPFQLGDMTPGREAYTADRVVETLAAGADNILAWTPVVKGVFKDANGDVLGDVKVGTDTYAFFNPANGKLYEDAAYTTAFTASGGEKAAYVYDNIIIPQAKLPTLKAEMKSIALTAKARRIAVNRYAA